jgi:transposase InsO family protein
MTAAERHALIDKMEGKGLSRRAACRWAGYSRAVGRYRLCMPSQDEKYLEDMRKSTKNNPRYGYRRIAVVSVLGFGRCWRLWKRNNFQLAAQRARKSRKPAEKTAQPQQAEYPNHVWTYDILFDRLANGTQFKTLSILDEFTRECVGILVATSILAQDVTAFLSTILKSRPAPVFLRSDNGSEFTAHAVQVWLEDNQVGPIFIPPGQPWKNGFIESFHDKFRDECLQREWFQSLLEAKVVIEAWRLHYNTRRPHSSLAYQTPAAFAAKYQH